MKNIALIFVAVYIIIPSQVHSQNLSTQIDSLLQDSLLTVSQIAIDVYDLQTEKYLYRKNEKLVLRPASNMKLLTTSAALFYLGEDADFETSFYTNGKVVDSVLIGDIIVKGGFDPLFTLKDFDTIIKKLKISGVRKVEGNIYADVSEMDSLYFGKGWMWDDNPHSFNPYLSPLNINKNYVTIYFSPSQIDSIAKVSLYPESNFYTFENSLVTTIEDTSNITVTRDWLNHSNRIIIKGDISHKKSADSAKVNIIDPHLFFIQLFGEQLNGNGIEFNGYSTIKKITDDFDTLYVNRRNIIEVINDVNKESDNLGAEMLIRKLSSKFFSGSASAEKGLRMIDSLVTVIGYNPKTFVFADGSGLSHYNLISAQLIVDLLKYLYKKQSAVYNVIYESLPIAGVDGTLKNRMRQFNLSKNIRAKTGTISGASTVSGYAKAANNHMLAFSIFVQNYSGSARKARRIQDEICKILASYK
jgi:D-alanyl-D-alanine carboxypeptidase/D-alanyl-D-alanine-endopeptidase (penicillin-binding protein 4)